MKDSDLDPFSTEYFLMFKIISGDNSVSKKTNIMMEKKCFFKLKKFK